MWGDLVFHFIVWELGVDGSELAAKGSKKKITDVLVFLYWEPDLKSD